MSFAIGRGRKVNRLTKRDEKGRAYFDDDGILIRGANGTYHQKKDMTGQFIHQRFAALDKAIDRLAAYEDIGLEPEEIEPLVSALQARGSCETCIRYENRRQCPMSYGESAETCLRERLCGCHDCQNGNKWVWRGDVPDC